MCSQPLWPCCPAVVVAGDADDDDGDADADDGDADDEAASSCKGQPGRQKNGMVGYKLGCSKQHFVPAARIAQSMNQNSERKGRCLHRLSQRLVANREARLLRMMMMIIMMMMLDRLE